jgi:antitoxin HigA-1
MTTKSSITTKNENMTRAVHPGRYFGNGAQLDLQSQYDIAIAKKERGPEIARRVRPADAA